MVRDREPFETKRKLGAALTPQLLFGRAVWRFPYTVSRLLIEAYSHRREER